MVKATVKLEGHEATGISGLSINSQLFHETGAGDPVILRLFRAIPECDPGSFDLGTGDSVTFFYYAKFPDSVNARTSRVLWKVSYDFGDGTRLVATNEAKFDESVKPYFVFMDTSGNPISLSEDTAISYYGGVVDLRFQVVDPDGDFPVNVIFERKVFQVHEVVYAPVFGLLNDLTKVLDDTSMVADAISADSTDILFFHWATDTTEIGTRQAIFIAEDNDEESSDTMLKIETSDTLLPPEDQVWVGRTGVVGFVGSAFSVPVEVYNTKTLEAMRLPFKINTIGGDHIDLLNDTSFISSRLEDPDVLEEREIIPPLPISEPETLTVDLSCDPFNPDPVYLPIGFGKVFDLIFKGDTTCFQLDKSESIIFLEPENPQPIYPDFESYEIMVVKGECTCGDANGDGEVTISDVVYIIKYLFRGGPPPVCHSDVNCDLVVNIADTVYIVRYLFFGGPAPCDPNGDGVPDC
jgi:hypothetical protein